MASLWIAAAEFAVAIERTSQFRCRIIGQRIGVGISLNLAGGLSLFPYQRTRLFPRAPSVMTPYQLWHQSPNRGCAKGALNNGYG